MRLIVIALFALFLIFQLTSACKCGCGCGGNCGCGCGCGCNNCCGCGWGGYGGYGYGGGWGGNHLHHVVHSGRSESCAPSVVGIPVLNSLGYKGCGCRGACSCGRSSWDD